MKGSDVCHFCHCCSTHGISADQEEEENVYSGILDHNRNTFQVSGSFWGLVWCDRVRERDCVHWQLWSQNAV